MPRHAEKLYQDLDTLEAKFTKRLRDYLNTTIKQDYRVEYLGRKTRYASRYNDDEADEMEHLEKRIITLRRKLGEPEDRGPLSYVDMYVREYDENWRRNQQIASEVLRRMENGIPAATELLGLWPRNRKVKFIRDRLPRNLRYPCDVRDIKDIIALLPEEDMRNIDTVHFCHHKAKMEGRARWWRSTIELNYTVDEHLRRLVLEGEPEPEYIKEWGQFGGTYLIEEGKQYVKWQSMAHAKRYVAFVFLHEVGHFVQLQSDRRRPIPYKQSELFANEYAYKQLKRVDAR